MANAKTCRSLVGSTDHTIASSHVTSPGRRCGITIEGIFRLWLLIDAVPQANLCTVDGKIGEQAPRKELWVCIQHVLLQEQQLVCLILLLLLDKHAAFSDSPQFVSAQKCVMQEQQRCR